MGNELKPIELTDREAELRLMICEDDFDYTKIFEEVVYEGETYTELSNEGADHLARLYYGFFETLTEAANRPEPTRPDATAALVKARDVLLEIREAKGAFSREPLTHAANVIQRSIDLATKALPEIEAAIGKQCGHDCGYREPYGFVPEADCPVHDKVAGEEGKDA